MAKYVLGIDIGGTKITGVVFDGRRAVKNLTIVTPKTLASFKYSLKHLLDFLSAGYHVSGIGIGMAGIVDQKRSVIRHSPNIKNIKNFNFKKFFGALGFTKVALENDANCFALAEANLGGGENYSAVIGITLGTGIGGGLIGQSRIFRGAHGSAGEVGHMMADFKHTFEYYFKIARDRRDNRALGEIVGNLTANLTNVLDAEVIVFGGGVATDPARNFLSLAKKTAQQNILNKKAMPKILISKLKHAGAIGAALLVKNL